MKNRACLVFSILILLSGSIWAQKPKDIPLAMMPNDSIHHPKSFLLCPTVIFDGVELIFDFSPATTSQVIIMDEDNHCQVVYSESFSSATQVMVDLEDEGIGEGRYLLWLFAFGQWWEGEFTLEEASNE